MDLSGKLAIGLLNAAPDATVIVDTRGVIVFANALVDEVFGALRAPGSTDRDLASGSLPGRAYSTP
jgi:PAS domain-containing protein